MTHLRKVHSFRHVCPKTHDQSDRVIGLTIRQLSAEGRTNVEIAELLGTTDSRISDFYKRGATRFDDLREFISVGICALGGGPSVTYFRYGPSVDDALPSIDEYASHDERMQAQEQLGRQNRRILDLQTRLVTITNQLTPFLALADTIREQRRVTTVTGDAE